MIDVIALQQAADVAVRVLGPTATSSSVDSAISTVAAAGLMSYLLEWAKHSSLVPWVTASTKTLNRAINAVLALLAALSIHYTFDLEAGALTITGLTASNIGHGIWEWGKQWAFQQMIYDGPVSKKDS